MIKESQRSKALGTGRADAAAPADVLIVSRDYDTRSIFTAALRSAGFSVRELADPDQVVAAARDCAIVVTDFPTRTESGRTVTFLLRHDPATRDITILNATTHIWGDELSEARAAGVDATLVLPAFPDRLVQCVARLLKTAGRAQGDTDETP